MLGGGIVTQCLPHSQRQHKHKLQIYKPIRSIYHAVEEVVAKKNWPSKIERPVLLLKIQSYVLLAFYARNQLNKIKDNCLGQFKWPATLKSR